MMEDAVAEVTDPAPSRSELAEILLGKRGVGIEGARQKVTDAGLAVGLVEEACPESEVEFRHHAAGCRLFFMLGEIAFGLSDPILLPKGQAGSLGVIPGIGLAAGGHGLMDGIAEGNLGELEGRVESLTQGHVQCVAAHGERQIGTILTVGVDPLRVENPFNLLEKRGIHVARSVCNLCKRV